MLTKSSLGGLAEGLQLGDPLDRRWEVFSSEVFSSLGGRKSLTQRSLARRFDLRNRISEVGDLEFGGL